MFKFKYSFFAVAGPSLLMGLLAASPAPAQGTTDLHIVKHSWSKERIDWEKNPFGATIENFGDMRNRVSNERRARSALEERTARTVQTAKERPPAPPRYFFNYKLAVLNAGLKAIKEIDWDYVFTDAVTGEELGRRQFTSNKNIAPGKRKELSVFASSSPTQKISVYTLGKKERDGLVERVMVVRILYADGTSWRPR